MSTLEMSVLAVLIGLAIFLLGFWVTQEGPFEFLSKKDEE